MLAIQPEDMYEKSILIIEDDEILQEYLEDLLRMRGFKSIHKANDGETGIQMARVMSPDIVLLDLGLPGIGGEQICKRIRVYANEIDMPIIVITGDKDRQRMEDLLAHGANDYIFKPLNSRTLISRIKFYLEYSQTVHDLIFFEKATQKDLDLARDIQENILPNLEDTQSQLAPAHIDFALFLGEDRLGGDSWGVNYFDNGDPFFFVFDVTGHGVNAAINNSHITGVANTLFREYKDKDAKNFDPAAYLKQLNEMLCDTIQFGTYCAAACFQYRQDEQSFHYAGCGFPDLKRLDKRDGSLDLFPCNGLPLAISKDGFNPNTGVIELHSHHMLLCMTDGLIESTSDEHDSNTSAKYGLMMPGERLLNLCLKTQALSGEERTSKEYIDLIIHEFEVNNYDLDADDITVLAFQNML